MSDRPPGDDPAMSTNPPPNPNPAPTNPQRTFFSSASAGEFFDQLRVVLDDHHAETLRAQEALVTWFSTPTTALTASIERLISAMPIPQRSPESPPPNGAQRERPPIPERPRSDVPPVSPYRSPYRSPTPPPPKPPVPPAREATAFTFATAETTASAHSGSTSSLSG